MRTRGLLVPSASLAIVAVAPGMAWAAWTTNGAGRAAAKSGTLTAPNFTTDTCTGKGPSTVSLAWSAVSNATSYRIEKSSDGSAYTTVTASTTSRTFSESTTLNAKNKTLYVRVSSLVGTAWSASSISFHETDNGSNCS